ncbi:MAG TPA: hypothetical protein PKD70_13565 [Saprospiraceae bacterium]|nr:hypothetical protein [Saprospiraceae bacterium]HMP14902.1 hypothetical protein [Saprospiraceae bacterium]
MDIQFVPHAEIDKIKWNSCVHYANNGNVFGYKWFLDFVAKDWDALVEGDYESVLPLVWRKAFFGGRELHQPSLMRELGVYSIHALSAKRITNFLHAIPDAYRMVEMVLNERIQLPQHHDFQTETLCNHQLLLMESYDVLAANYTPPLRERLRLATDNQLIATSNIKPETLANFYRKYAKDRRHLERNFHALQRIMYNVLHRGWGFASGIEDASGNLLAANFFIYSHHKVLSLMPLEAPVGAQTGALAQLFDLLIRTHAGRPLILDFNTSGADELALYFGAQENLYYRIRRDRRWLF